jgi:chorismate dehydratase
MLRCGRIVYTNDIPIYAAFDEGAVPFPGSLSSDVPARLNEQLLGGRLDLSPVSAFFYAQNADRLALLPGVCIGSRRDVWSVILASSVPPSDLAGATIAATTESASGRNLLRVLLERRFGLRARFEDTADPLGAMRAGKPTLLIGDLAIDAQFELPPQRVHDLGTLWHEWTGLDMVYAVWAVRRDVLGSRRSEVAAVCAALAAAKAWGEANAARVVELAQAVRPRRPGFYSAYYETLNFDFDPQAQAGLARFIEEARAAGAIAGGASAIPEDVRVAR